MQTRAWKIGDPIEVEMFRPSPGGRAIPEWLAATVINPSPLAVEFVGGGKLVLHPNVNTRTPARRAAR